MARLEEFDDVQLDVEFTQADSRSNLTTNENIAISFGKISKWYEALVPTGGSSGQFLAWNSSGTAKWVSNPNVDTKVTSTLLTQSTAAARYLPTFVSAAGNSGVNIMNSFSFRHTVGTTSAIGNSRIVLGNPTASGTADNEEGQIVLFSSGTSYHTIKGSATSSTVTHSLPTTGGTILNTGTTSFTQTLASGTKVGSIKINGTSQDIYAPTNTNTTYTLTQDDTDGHKITLTPSSGTAQTITIPDNDTTYSAGSGLSLSGTTFNHSNSVTAVTSAVFKKITYDAQGHITGTSNVVKGDIPALDYVPNTNAGVNAAINLLSTGSSNPNINDYYISQFAAGGTTTTTYHRRPLSALWNTLRSLITIETSGSGNAITSASITNDGNNRKITFSKGSTFSLSSHTHDNYLGAVKIGNYYGMAWPDGTDKGTNTWIRTTRLGLIPYAANTDTTDGNVSSLGTSAWTFDRGYINNLYYKDLKPVTVVAGSTADNGIDKMAGSFFFSGNNLFGGTYDWAGIQVGYSADKWQIVGNGSGGVMFRQNDDGGTDTTGWSDFKALVIPDNITGSDGITVTNTTRTLGSGDTALTYDIGVNITHSNSVTAETTFDKSRFKYDAQGHITDSSYYVHTAAGTGGVAGWVKIATMKHLNTYDNTPIMLTISQRGNLLTYRLHIQFSSANSTDPPLGKFIISSDEADVWVTVYPRAYMIKTAAGTWDLYIEKKDGYEAIAVTEFDVGKYFTDRMSWTWLDVQTADSDITGGTEATRKVYTTTDENLLQSNTATSSYRPIVVGTTATTDRTALNTTVTGRGYVSNLMFSKPDIGYLYASAFSTSSYIDGTGVQLARYGLYLKSYAEQNTGTKYSYSRYALRTYSGKLSSDNGMLVEICGGGLTIVGSGESATTLSNLIADDQTVENPERLDVGGTLATSFQGSSEQLILSSDANIYFLTNCNTVADRMPVVLDTDSAFYPGTTKTGSIGTNSYYWNTAYIDSLNLSNTSVLSKASGDAYYYVERTDTGVRLGFGVGTSGINHGVYSYELGGWLIYGNATDVLVRANLYNPSTEASLYALPLFGGTPSTGAHALYNNNGFRYSTLEGTTSAPGLARLVLGNGTASGTEGNKRGTIRLYSQSSNYIDLVPSSTSTARTITIPAVTATMAVNRKALITDSTNDFASYAWHKFAEVTITSTNYDYVATFLISSGFDVSSTFVPRKIGVLTMHVRTGSTRIFNSGQFEWLFAGEQIDPRNFVMVYTDTANTSCKVELWYKQIYRYEGYTFNVVEEHTRTVKEIFTMTIYDQSGHGSASYTAGTGFLVSKMGKLQTGGYILNNEFNIYTHEIKTDSYKVRDIAVSLNDVEGIMGTDVLCYTGYETNTADDTTLGSYGDISEYSSSVSFSGYLSRFSYFTVLMGIGTDITARTTIHVSAIAGYQSYQLIWGSHPTQIGGSLCITSGLVNISDSNGTITMNFGKCSSYWEFPANSSTYTKGTTPNVHILKVYGHCIRSNGYH